MSRKMNRHQPRLKLNLRRMRGKQVRVMAEAAREVIRKRLGEAQFISLAMDDRKYQRSCDSVAMPHGSPTSIQESSA